MRQDDTRNDPWSNEPGEFENVVIGSSLTTESDEFLRSALSVTRALRARIRLVHALSIEPLAYGFDGVLPPDILGNLERLQTDDLARQIRETQVLEHELISADIVASAPHKALASVAGATCADLIIVGASDAPGPGVRLLGSTTDRVIRSAHCPVLILRSGMPLPPPRVLAPVDLSRNSALAVETGVDFLMQMNADSCSAVETLFVLSPLNRGLPSQFSPQQIHRMAKEELLRFTFEHTEGWRGKIETKLRIGEARQQLLKELEDQPVDLIVLGSQGHGRVHRALIGSVAGQIACRATCSVLFVPRQDDQQVIEESKVQTDRAEFSSHLAASGTEGVVGDRLRFG